MFRTLTLIATCAAMTACVSVLPEQKVAPTGLYRLGPVMATQTVSATILVREPEAPRPFAGRAIAAKGADGALRYIPGVEWADNTTRMMQMALLDSLQASDGAAVMAAGAAAPGDYEVSWRVSEFLLDGAEARCALEVTLLKGKTRAPLGQKLIRQSASVSGEANANRAQALTKAGKACVADAAAFVAEKTKTPRS